MNLGLCRSANSFKWMCSTREITDVRRKILWPKLKVSQKRSEICIRAEAIFLFISKAPSFKILKFSNETCFPIIQMVRSILSLWNTTAAIFWGRPPSTAVRTQEKGGKHKLALCFDSSFYLQKITTTLSFSLDSIVSSQQDKQRTLTVDRPLE